MKDRGCTSGIVHSCSSSYGLNIRDCADLSAKLQLLVRVVLKMWPLADIHGDAVDVTFVLLFPFFKKRNI